MALSIIRLILAVITLFTTSTAFAEPKAAYEIQPYTHANYQNLAQGRNDVPTDLRPKEIYGSAPQVGIRIANGGAGYTGLLRALSQAYLAQHPTINGQPFSIAWYATNTTYSFQALRDHVVDLALVYEIWPQALAGNHRYAQKMTPLFRDAFIFVGPTANPAGLISSSAKVKGDSIDEILDKIIVNGCKEAFAPGCSMYLSRSDLSGTYKKETTYLIAHRTPYDLIQNSPWYYAHPATPREALKEAQQKGLYEMNDNSTWISHPELQAGLRIYANGALGFDKNLLNPCYGLLANSQYLQSDQPRRFLKWLAGPDGQKIMAAYGKKEFGAAVVRPW
jgi:ABC-type tungstate transport system permease subunit